MSNHFRPYIREPVNAFLWPQEEVFLRAIFSLYTYHNCKIAAANVARVLHIAPRRDGVIRSWLRNGLLDMDDLLQYESAFTPLGLVEIDE
jgi:hypothetical protein